MSSNCTKAIIVPDLVALTLRSATMPPMVTSF